MNGIKYWCPDQLQQEIIKNLLKSLPSLRATFEKNALSGRLTTAIMYTNTFFPLIFVSFSCVLLGTLPKFVSFPECAKTILNI